MWVCWPSRPAPHLGWIQYPKHDTPASVQTPQAQGRVKREKGLSMHGASSISLLSAAALFSVWSKQIHRTHLKMPMCRLSLRKKKKKKQLCPLRWTPLKFQEVRCARSSQFFPAPNSWNRLSHYNWLIHSFRVKHGTSPLLSSRSKRGRNKIYDSASKPSCAAGPSPQKGGRQEQTVKVLLFCFHGENCPGQRVISIGRAPKLTAPALNEHIHSQLGASYRPREQWGIFL